jgi:hypothetical protein
LVIPDVPGADGILTGKLFEYIGSETPILGMGPCVGEASRILTETQAGTMFERTDVSGMVAFIEQVFLRRDDTAAASQRSGNATNYSRYSLTEKLTGLIEAARPVR